MSGSRQGTTYFSDVVGSPLLPVADHKALFTRAEGVFVLDSAGNEVRLDDYQLIQDISGSLNASITGQAVAMWQGSILVPEGQSVVTVTYSPAVDITGAYPVVTLVGPNDNSVIYPLSINDRTTTSFDVVLGGAPDVPGYSINWFLATGGVGAAGGGSGGGGGTVAGSISVSGGAVTVTDVTTIQFAGATVSDAGAGKALITVVGGSGDPTPTLVTGSGDTFSPDGLDDVYSYTLTGPATINAPASMVDGSSVIFKLTQPVGGGASLVLADAGGFTWKKPNGSIALSTDTGGAEDILTVLRIGTNLYVSIVKNF
jgi:hypothetical protein